MLSALGMPVSTFAGVGSEVLVGEGESTAAGGNKGRVSLCGTATTLGSSLLEYSGLRRPVVPGIGVDVEVGVGSSAGVT